MVSRGDPVDDAGQVDQDVDLAELGQGSIDHRLDFFLAPHVDMEGNRRTTQLTGLGGQLLVSLIRHVGEKKGRARTGERESDRTPETTGGPGDEDGLAAEVERVGKWHSVRPRSFQLVSMTASGV